MSYFTKVHYEFLAGTIKEALLETRHIEEQSAIGGLAIRLAKKFQDTQPQFEAQTFLKTCGIDAPWV